jgi:hypothetical protein
MDFREIWFVFADWIHLAQVRDRWWALAKTVSIKCCEFIDKVRVLLASQGVLCSMVFVT